VQLRGHAIARAARGTAGAGCEGARVRGCAPGPGGAGGAPLLNFRRARGGTRRVQLVRGEGRDVSS